MSKANWIPMNCSLPVVEIVGKCDVCGEPATMFVKLLLLPTTTTKDHPRCGLCVMKGIKATPAENQTEMGA